MIFLELLKLVFKNFFHWTLSRIVIYIFSGILAFVGFLPFFLVLLILGYIDPINWGEIFYSIYSAGQFLGLVGALSSSPIFFISEALITLLGIGFSIGVFSYKSVLLYRLLESYRNEKRLKIRENLHLDSLVTFVKVFSKLFLYLLTPIIGFVIFFFLIVLLFGGLENIMYIAESQAISAISIVLLLACIITILIFFYMSGRFIFSYASLALHPEKNSTEVIQDSKDKSRGKYIFLIIGGLLAYMISTIPTHVKEEGLINESRDIEKYLFFRSLETYPSSASMKDLGLKYENYEEVQNEPSFIALDSEYKGISLDELELQKVHAELYANLLSIFNFLIFFGIFELVVLSLYLSLTSQEKKSTSYIQRIKKIFSKKSNL